MIKKILFVVHPHSIVDVITNSSTELFVIDTDKSVDLIKEILNLAIELENKVNNNNLTFEDVFDEPKVADESDINNDWGYRVKKGDITITGCSDNTIPWWIMDFIESTFGNVRRVHLG